MGLINWIFDIYQHSKIDEVRREAIEARLEAARVNQGGRVDAVRLEREICPRIVRRSLLGDESHSLSSEFRHALQYS